MISSKDMLLADVIHAERLRQAEHAQLVQQAVRARRRPLAAGWWWLWLRRGGRGLAGTPIPAPAAPQV
jgi:hypothetical protein